MGFNVDHTRLTDKRSASGNHGRARTSSYTAIVGSAFVVDGGIYRHECVAETAVAGLMQVQMDAAVPVLSAILTPAPFS